jgi:hypothetical protein
METESDRPAQGNRTGERRPVVPGMKRQDNSYVPAVVPPEWEA